MSKDVDNKLKTTNQLTDDIVAEVNGGNGKEIIFDRPKFANVPVVLTNKAYQHIEANSLVYIVNIVKDPEVKWKYDVLPFPINPETLTLPVRIPESDLRYTNSPIE